MRGALLLIAGVVYVLSYNFEAAASQPEIKITGYPKEVYAGEEAQVSVEWKNLPSNKDYLLRVQLENCDLGTCVMQDIEGLPSEGTKAVSLEVPPTLTLVTLRTGFRFVVAFLSKKREWEDLACSSATDKDVEIKPRLSIKDYPVVVIPGKTSRVRLSWDRAPSAEEYKLVVQLENFEAQPQVCVAKTITPFKPADSVTLSIEVPSNLMNNLFVSGYRFVAAFLSKSREWDEIYAVDVTPKNVEVWKDAGKGILDVAVATGEKERMK